jgi:hypothetical protein
MGQFLYERFSYNEVHQFDSAYIRGNSDWGFAELGKPNMPPEAEMPYLSATPEHCHWERNNANELIMHYQPGAANDKLKFPVTTKIILDKDKNYFDIELTIDKPAEPLPEAGWICLPFSIPHPQFRVGRNGSIIDPVKDINVKGVNRHLYEVGTGVALFDASGRGIGICPLDAPLVSLGEPGVFKYDTSYVPTQPNVFFNLFNNHWSTNYRLWNEGKWTYTFRIWAFDKYDAESSLITPSLEALYPVQYGYQNHGAPQKNLTIASTGIELSRKGISITAFETDPFGNTGTLLRLWEMTGKSGEVTISLPQDLHFKKATPVTLRSEKAGKAIKITNGKFSYNIKAFAPLSFLLE